MSLICTNKHSYLLRGFACVKSFNPRLVSRLVDKELAVCTTYRNLEPPFPPLASSSPVTHSPNVDGTRTKLAFGRWALPRLKKQINRDDIYEVMQALNSIHDLVHDPEKGFEAIKIGLVDRMTNMMLHERDFVREKICMILYTLAGLEAGRRAIMRRYKILQNLALLLEDKKDAIRYKAQLVVEILSLSPAAATGLNCADFLILILRLIGGEPKSQNENVVIYHLATLKMLLQGGVKLMALKHNAMNILMEKIESPNEKIKMLALDCIALLCEQKAGREEGAEKNLGFVLCKKLFDPSMDVRIKVMGALAFATIESDTRSKLCKKCTFDVVMDVLENFHNSEGQLMAMKVLSNMAEDPQGKSYVKKNQGRIKDIFTNNDVEVERHKKLLLNFLKRI